MRRSRMLALVAVLGLSPVSSALAQSCVNEALVADGRIYGPYSTPSGFYWGGVFTPTAGRSYSIEVAMSVADLCGGCSSSTVNVNTTSCPTTNMAGLTDTSNVEPRLSSFERFSLVPATGASIYVRLVNHGMRLKISETTLYNPSWSTFSGFSSQWGLQNTTSATITGTLTVRESAGGSAVYTRAVTLSPNGTTFVTTGDTFSNGPIPANRAGNASFAHNGPPGSVLGDGYLIGPGLATVVPTLFRPVRE